MQHNQPVVIAVIPARGGSKGIPGKNVKVIAGKPLLVWSIENARACTVIDRVVVSTDDAMIAQVARDAGAEALDRPAELATDGATSEVAIDHVLRTLRARGERVDVCCFMQATSPITLADDLDRLIAQVTKHGKDSAAFFIEDHGHFFGVDDMFRERIPRQKKSAKRRETGNAWAFTVQGFLEQQCRLFGNVGLVPIDPPRNLEIDSWHEFRIAEFLLKEHIWTPQDAQVDTVTQAQVS
jgi:CMP-N-acetylneuraminic acid synthetase